MFVSRDFFQVIKEHDMYLISSMVELGICHKDILL